MGGRGILVENNETHKNKAGSKVRGVLVENNKTHKNKAWSKVHSKGCKIEQRLGLFYMTMEGRAR